VVELPIIITFMGSVAAVRGLLICKFTITTTDGLIFRFSDVNVMVSLSNSQKVATLLTDINTFLLVQRVRLLNLAT
jgi:hypothetical protein